MTYFELFGIKPAYFLSLEQITKKFYELSRVLHPDKFQTKGIEELAEATRKSAELNSAFKALKDDDERAYYIFELAKFNLGEAKKTLPPDLAEEYFSLQEVLEDGNNPHETKNLIQNFSSLLKKEALNQEEILKKAFRDWEKAQSPLNERGFPFFTRANFALQQKSYMKSMAMDLEKKWPM